MNLHRLDCIQQGFRSWAHYPLLQTDLSVGSCPLRSNWASYGLTLTQRRSTKVAQYTSGTARLPMKIGIPPTSFRHFGNRFVLLVGISRCIYHISTAKEIKISVSDVTRR
jgi:hypothetical protein